ncbi:MAG: hypothetical protein HY314_10185 [Acidobacteria bacterium]|nr:hypothetical protein [Acidobacteriota bacterium]
MMRQRGHHVIIGLLLMAAGLGVSFAQDHGPWVVPRILNTYRVDWTTFPGTQGKVHRYEKILAEDPTSKSPARWAVRMIYAPPGWVETPTITQRSFAEYFEWAFFLAGEQPFCSYDDPSDETCNLSIHRPGTFMDRPRYSVHGAADPRAEPGLPISKTGTISLFWHEKDAEEYFFPRPAPERFLKMDKSLFTQPTEIDTDEMDWQPHPTLKGWLIKPLADHKGITKVSIQYMPAGWVDEANLGKQMNVKYHEFRYILSGEMPFWYYKGSDQRTPERAMLREGYFVHMPPGAVLGAEIQPISRTGCSFLQIVRYDLK